ncbi:securin-like [Polyodon spathula]|uniref:securin-like n=1 Tax=Polyodon spathula TaxID=7913 RepID=UPI001B7EAB30|nr:securin-like [Polyodon spathula]
MATMIFVDKENGELGTTVVPKNRTRLLSAPANTFGEKVLQTPRPGKVFGMAKPTSARKALGTVNKICSVTRPDFSGNKHKSKVAAKPTEKVKVCIPVKELQEYPEIEKFIPYNPVEFESFDVPEDQRLSHLCLAGLAAPTPKEELDSFSVLHSCMKWSPLKFQKENFCAEVDSFLQTVSQLTIELPPLDLDQSC